MSKHIAMYRSWLLFVFLCLAATPAWAEPGGAYSNHAEGFNIESLCLRKDGKAFYFVAVGGVPVTWRFNSTENKIVIRGNLGPNAAIQEKEFRYIPGEDVIGTEKKTNPRDAFLKKISEEIPDSINTILNRFDWQFERHVVEGVPKK